MRLTISIISLIIGAALLAFAVKVTIGSPAGAIALNLGTEIIGITVTISIIERLLERNQLTEEARRIARNSLHDIDHAIWVWQGGSRRFDVNELVTLLGLISDDDPLPSFTHSLLVTIGARAENTVRIRTDLANNHSKLISALRELGKLAGLRDSNQLSLTPSAIAVHISSAITDLVQVAAFSDETWQPINIDNISRETSEEMQRWRHYGDQPEKKYDIDAL